MNRTELRRRIGAGLLSRRAAELVVRHERAAVELRTAANELKALQTQAAVWSDADEAKFRQLERRLAAERPEALSAVQQVGCGTGK